MTSSTPRPQLQADAVFFDYGATLDTDGRHWYHVLADAYCACGVSVTDEALRAAYVHGERSLGASSIIAPTDTFPDVLGKKVRLEMDHLAASGHWQPTAAERARAEEGVVRWCDDYVRRNLQQTRRVLEAMAPRRLYLVSNFYGNLEAVLRHYDLRRYFDGVVESAAVGIRKPDPAIYALALSRSGVEPSRVVVVGDSFGKDIQPAKTLGCQAVWLKGQEWAATERDERLPDAIIAHLSELPAVLAPASR